MHWRPETAKYRKTPNLLIPRALQRDVCVAKIVDYSKTSYFFRSFQHTLVSVKEFETQLDPRLLGLSCLRQWQWFRSAVVKSRPWKIEYAIFQGLDFTTALPLLLHKSKPLSQQQLYTISFWIALANGFTSSYKYLISTLPALLTPAIYSSFSAFSIQSPQGDHVPRILHAAVIPLLPRQTLSCKLSCKLCAELLDVQVVQPCQSSDAMMLRLLRMLRSFKCLEIP